MVCRRARAWQKFRSKIGGVILSPVELMPKDDLAGAGCWRSSLAFPVNRDGQVQCENARGGPVSGQRGALCNGTQDGLRQHS